MTRPTAKTFAILMLALPGAAAIADPLQDELRVCRGLTDDEARLICYDAAVDRSRNKSAGRSAAAPPPAPAPIAAGTAPAAAATATATATAASAAGTASQIDQEDLFGKSGDELQRTVEAATGAEPVDSLSATVAKLHKYNYDRVLITLDNGQVWKQVDASSLRLRVGDAVDIERAALGSFMLRKQGSKRSMRVSRED
jgi:hypothetical protein